MRLFRAGLSATGGVARKKRLKQHLLALHRTDADRWTPHALSGHLGVPLENMQAVLTLDDLEKEGGPADELGPAFSQLALDAEEYIEDEYLESPPATVTDADSPSFGLQQMSLEQEARLVAAVATRFDAPEIGAALREAVAAHADDDLAALRESLGGGSSPPGGEAAAGASGLLQAITIDSAASVIADVPREPNPRASRAGASSAASAPAATTAEAMREAAHEHGPVLAEKMKANLGHRRRRLANGGEDIGRRTPRNGGRLIFADTSSQKDRAARVSRVWVTQKEGEKGAVASTTRPPTEEEHRHVSLRVHAPSFKPRVKRNK